MTEATFRKPADTTPYTDRRGAYGILVEDGRLACADTGNGLLLPGGGIEAGETPEQALERKCVEEIGKRVRVGAFVCEADQYVDAPIAWIPLHAIGRFYRVKAVETLPVGTEHTLVWVPVGEAAERLLLPYQQYAVRRALGST